MKRADLEHVLRAASAITNERDFVVIGSQADRATLLERIATLPIDEQRKATIRSSVASDFAARTP